MDMYGKELYPNPYTFKYPKAGEDNSVVTAHLWNHEIGASSTSVEGCSLRIPAARAMVE